MTLHIVVVLLAAAFVRKADLFRIRTYKETLRPTTQCTMTLSSRISDALSTKFVKQKGYDISRVIKCWNRFAAGEKLERYLDERKEIQQSADCFVDGLTATCFHNLNIHPWTKPLEAEYKDIWQELLIYEKGRVKLSGANAVPSLHELSSLQNKMADDDQWLGPRDAVGGSYGPEWKTLGLQDRSVWNVDLTKHFPRTIALLEANQVPSCEVFFAKQGPKSGIKPHSDRNNFIITCHVGLEVPEGECSLVVGNEEYFWKNGEAVVFDTSIIHSTENKSNRTRYVLLIRFWHPELTKQEIEAFKFIFDYLDHAAMGEDALYNYEMQQIFMGKDNHKGLQVQVKDSLIGKPSKSKSNDKKASPVSPKRGFGAKK